MKLVGSLWLARESHVFEEDQTATRTRSGLSTMRHLHCPSKQHAVTAEIMGLIFPRGSKQKLLTWDMHFAQHTSTYVSFMCI